MTLPRRPPARRARVTEQATPRPPVATFLHGSTTYTFPIDGRIRRVPFRETPPVSPPTGEAGVKTRPYHNVVSFKNFINAFAHEIEHEFSAHHGIIDHLASSTMTTNFDSGIWFGPAENAVTNPTDGGTSAYVPPTGDASSTASNKQPKGAVFFAGSGATGTFTWRIDETSAPRFVVDALRWGGTSFTEIEVADSSSGSTTALDMTIHKDALCFLVWDNVSTSTLKLYRSTNGTSFSAAANTITADVAGAGSKLYSDGNRLYVFAVVSGSIDVYSTDDNGGSPWDARSTDFPGSLRDILAFEDRGGTVRPMVLLETGLFYYDTTSFIFVQVAPLPGRARAMTQFGDELLIFMDAGRVLAYKANGALRDISPDLPDGFDFGSDTSGQVCLATGLLGVYAFWSGADEGGNAQKPLILLWNGTGWHFVWQKADTSISAAARFLFVDPISGDLVFGVQDAVDEDTTLLRLKDIEVDPAIQTTLDRKTAGQMTSARQDFGSPIVSTTAWDMFIHSSGLGVNKSVAIASRTNGSTGAYTTAATVTADNTLITFPNNANPPTGVNFRDGQFKWTFAANAATDVIRFFGFDLGYNRAWPPRYLHVMDVITNVDVPGVPPADVLLDDITTVLALNTKGTLTYNGKTYYALPILESEIDERSAELVGAKRTGTARLVFLEA